MYTTRPFDQERRLLLTVPEVARELKLSERYVWTLIKTRDLPSIKIGRRVLVSRKSLEEWIDRRQSPPDEDPENYE